MGYIKKSKFIIMSISASILITGCSVAPEPILPDDLKKLVEQDLKILNTFSQPVTKAISLDDAIQRAVQNNIRNQVQIMESALAHQQIDLVYYDMLPSLTTNAGYSARNNYAASASTTFEDGKPTPIIGTPTYSISQDKERLNANVSFSWNVLDFGLSYVRAQQQSDKYLMAKESERKVIHNIVQEVRRTYYKTVSADALLKKIIPMMKEVKSALADSRKVKKLRLSSPLQALSYQRDLLEVLRSLQALERNLIGAKIELAELMGLKAGTRFELSEKVETNYKLPQLHLKLNDMEQIALERRPEILESRYKERISQKETTAAMLKMLPGINLNAGVSYDDSDYLLNNDWMSYGASVSWNLLNIFKSGTYQKIAETKIELAREQKLAVSMAVLSQVHLAVVNFNQAKKEYELSREYLEVAEEIFKLTKVGNKLNMNSKLVFIKEKLNFILSTLRHSSSYANVQNSYGRIFASLGTSDDINKKKPVTKKDMDKKVPTAKKADMTKSKKTEVKKAVDKIKQVVSTPKKRYIQSSNNFKISKIGTAKKTAYVKLKANYKSEYQVILPKNKKIGIIDTFYNQSGLWAQTPYGYVKASSLNIITTPNTKFGLDILSKNEKVKYIGKSFRAGNIRSQANWQSEKRYLLPKNKTINIYSTVSTKGGIWYKTKYGYISSLVVKIKEKM